MTKLVNCEARLRKHNDHHLMDKSPEVQPTIVNQEGDRQKIENGTAKEEVHDAQMLIAIDWSGASHAQPKDLRTLLAPMKVKDPKVFYRSSAVNKINDLMLDLAGLFVGEVYKFSEARNLRISEAKLFISHKNKEINQPMIGEYKLEIIDNEKVTSRLTSTGNNGLLKNNPYGHDRILIKIDEKTYWDLVYVPKEEMLIGNIYENEIGAHTT